MKLSLFLLSLTALSVSSFVPSQPSAIQDVFTLTASPFSWDGHINDVADTRRDFVAKTVATALTAATASIAGLGVLAPSPANAVKGADKVNLMLKAYVKEKGVEWSMIMYAVVGHIPKWCYFRF
jgi:hypothetical protein